MGAVLSKSHNQYQSIVKHSVLLIVWQISDIIQDYLNPLSLKALSDMICFTSCFFILHDLVVPHTFNHKVGISKPLFCNYMFVYVISNRSLKENQWNRSDDRIFIPE